MEVKEILQRSKVAFEKRGEWKSTLEECYELAQPVINPYVANKNAPRSMSQMYSSTALVSANRAANRLLMELTPPDDYWLDMKAGPYLQVAPDVTQEAIDGLEQKLGKEVVPILNLIFSSSNFVDEIWRVYLDLVISGMGALLTLEDLDDPSNPVSFEAVSQAELAIEDTASGKLDVVYRKRNIKIREIKRLWTDAEIPDDLSKDKFQGQEDPEVELLEVTYNSHEKKTEKPWIYEVIYKNGEGEGEKLVSREYSSNPWGVLRWSRVPGSSYGPGPVMMALPDIRTENRVMKMVLQNAALSIAGLWMVRDDGVVNPANIMITPGLMIPVSSTGGSMGASIQSLDTGRGFDVGQIVLQDLRVSIKKILFDNSLPDATGAVRSPTEIIQRVKELTQDIGGAIGRITSDIVSIVRRVADILSNSGIIPKMVIDQMTLKVLVISPLARVQQMQAVERLVQWYEIAVSIGGPELAGLIAKLEEVLLWIADQMGVSSDLIRTEEERLAVKKEQQAMLENMARLQNAQNTPPSINQTQPQLP